MRPFITRITAAFSVLSLTAAPAMALPFLFSTGTPDGKIATASRPDSGGAFEIESADDFVLSTQTNITSATFTGLIPVGSSVSSMVVEIYRVFPNDSNVGRTSGDCFCRPRRCDGGHCMIVGGPGAIAGNDLCRVIAKDAGRGEGQPGVRCNGTP